MAYGTVNVGEKVTLAGLGGVPSSRKVNGKPLSADITLAAGDVGAVPTGRTVNGKALSANITLSAGDVGALASGGTAAAATKLVTARTIRTNLASTATASFNGTANITPGVTGTLAVGNGGTGATSLSSITVGKANACNGLTFAIKSGSPATAVNNKVQFCY